MNSVGFSKTLLQRSPPINQNLSKALIINQILYQTPLNNLNQSNSQLSPRQIRLMKFRKWQAEDYFVLIAQEILRLGHKRWETYEGSLEGRVKVGYKWAVYNWVIEFQNLMHWAKSDSTLLHCTNNFSFHHQLSSPTHEHYYGDKTHPYRRQESNLLEMQQQLINQVESIKSRNNYKKLKLGKCLEFLIQNLSTIQFYALQFFLKLLKISQFYGNMKSFSQVVARFQSQYSYFNSHYDSVVNGKDACKNEQKQCVKEVNQYGQVFYNKNQPQLKKIKSEILSIIQNYQLALMISDTPSNWYEIQLCIKLLRNQIYKQQIPTQQKQQQFDFVIFNSGIDQILTKITQIRLKDKNQSFLRKKTLSVTSLIKINDQILDVATEIVEVSMNNQMKINEDSSLQITTSVHEINSENSNLIVEEQTKKFPSTQPHIDTLGFSKSFEVSSSNEHDQQQKQPFDIIHQKQLNIEGCKQQQQQNQVQNNLLQMLEDQKTIRENFSLLSVSEIKKVKRIKKMSRKQLYKFQCVNGKITFREDQSKDQSHQMNNKVHEIRNKYKEKRLQQLQAKKKHFIEKSIKQDSLIQEENKQKNKEMNVNTFKDRISVEKKIYQLQTPVKENHQCKSDGKPQSPPNILKNESMQKNNPNSVSHEQSQTNQPGNKFSTPVKDSKRTLGFAPIPNIDCSQNKPPLNHINAIQNYIEKPTYLLCQKKSQQENCSLILKKDDNSNFKSLSNQKTINFKETYKFANNRFAPLSKPAHSGNRFNPKMNFIKKNKNFSRQPRPNFQPNSLQMNYFKRLHQQKFDTQFVASFEEDEFLVDETPPKYKKAKVGNE